MSHPLVTVNPNTSLKDALWLIVSRDIRRLPVVDSGKLVGIMTDKDTYKAIAKSEALFSALVNDELLVKQTEEIQQP